MNETIDPLTIANSVRWYGHVLRRALDVEVEGQRKEGRPKRTWKRLDEEESVKTGLRREDVLCPSTWSVGVNKIAAGRKVISGGQEGYLRRTGRLHKEDRKAISGGQEGYIRRTGRLSQEDRKAISGGQEGYIRRAGRLSQEDRKATSGGQEGYIRRTGRLSQEDRKAISGGQEGYLRRTGRLSQEDRKAT